MLGIGFELNASLELSLVVWLGLGRRSGEHSTFYGSDLGLWTDLSLNVCLDFSLGLCLDFDEAYMLYTLDFKVEIAFDLVTHLGLC